MKIHKAVFTLILALACKPDTHLNLVTISGEKLLVNNETYFIKGICYHPVPQSSTKWSFDLVDQNLSLMVEAGINTIRVYEPIMSEEVLDKIWEVGLNVIISFGYDQKGTFDISSGTYLDYVEKYKSHPSILAWELGNEYNYHPEWFTSDIKNWYQTLNHGAAFIHELDKIHPVATAHGELPDGLARGMCPNIDILGMNVYRWNQPASIIEDWKKLSDKPMYFYESVADSYMAIAKAGFEAGENQRAQAVANANIIDEVLKKSAHNKGLFIFLFTDGLWKAGNPNVQDVGGWAPNSSGVPYDGAPNEEYWGIVDINRNKKLTFNLIKERFNKKNNHV